MTCDESGCTKPDTISVAGERPSDKTEIVSVLAYCEDHAQTMSPPVTLAYLKEEWTGGLIAAANKDWNTYIESPEAAKRRHIFLTI